VKKAQPATLDPQEQPVLLDAQGQLDQLVKKVMQEQLDQPDGLVQSEQLVKEVRLVQPVQLDQLAVMDQLDQLVKKAI
jgi:hypothetical protein